MTSNTPVSNTVNLTNASPVFTLEDVQLFGEIRYEDGHSAGHAAGYHDGFQDGSKNGILIAILSIGFSYLTSKMFSYVVEKFNSIDDDDESFTNVNGNNITTINGRTINGQTITTIRTNRF